MSIPRISAYPLPARTQWPEARVAWRIDPARAVVLVHDMQDYFVDFFDRAAMPMPAVVSHIRQIVQAARQRGVPVCYTAQPGQQSPTDRALLQDWWGPGITAQPHNTGIVDTLAPQAHERVFTKWRYSAFIKSDLQDWMKASGRDQLIVCGVYAHIGVMTTCVDAFMRDIQPFVIADAVADFSAAEHDMALKWIGGRCGVVTGTSDALHALGHAAPSALPQSEFQLLESVAELLDVPASDLAPEQNLIDMGLDSIRLMRLLTRWREAGCHLAFTQLAETPTVAAWWLALQPSVAPPPIAEPDRIASTLA